jgi:hypothetical protein
LRIVHRLRQNQFKGIKSRQGDDQIQDQVSKRKANRVQDPSLGQDPRTKLKITIEIIISGKIKTKKGFGARINPRVSGRRKRSKVNTK